MKRSCNITITCAVALGVLVTADAGAQEKPWVEQRVAAPTRAVELTLATGYTQPFGMLREGVGMPSVAGGGIGAELGVGYRFDPRWSVAGLVQYQELTPERANGTRGMLAGVAATYHLSSQTRLDPWVEVGAGYRLLWETYIAPDSTVLTHGFEMARVRLGLDLRGAEVAAIGPFIGADMTVFLWDNAGGGSDPLEDPRVNTFVLAGIQGRLDVGGARVGTTTTTSATTEQ